MNIELIDSLIDDGWSEKEIVAAFNKRKNEKLKDVKLTRAREDLIDTVIEYLNAVNPDLVNFADEEEAEKFCADAVKELTVLEKFLKNQPKAKKKARESADDVIWKFIKENGLA